MIQESEMNGKEQKKEWKSKIPLFVILFLIGLFSLSFIVLSMIFKDFFSGKNLFLFNFLFDFCVLSLCVVILLAFIHAYTDLLSFGRKKSDDEIQVFKEKRLLDAAFRSVKRLLKKSRGSYLNQGIYNYSLPWYIVAGDEGAGKTSFLVNSGVDLPGGNQAERNIAIQDGGGIILCDQAIFVDLPSGFLKGPRRYLGDHLALLLRRFRPAQPLNGILYIIDLSRIISGSSEEINAIGLELRACVNRIQDQLGITPPVYVIFSHLDLIEGFSDFFDGTPAAPRSQVFGITLPYVGSAERYEDSFLLSIMQNKFDEFIQWQVPRTYERITREIVRAGRYRTFFFPIKLASLKPRLVKLFEKLLKSSEIDEDILVRGLYFVSSARSDDKSRQPLRSDLAPDAALPNDSFAGYKQAHFIKEIINSLILQEVDLVGYNEKETARSRSLKAIFLTAGGLLALLFLVWMIVSFQNNNTFINLLTLKLDEAGKEFSQFAGIQQNKAIFTESYHVLPVLQSLEDLPGGWNDLTEVAPLSEKAGLSQRKLLSKDTRDLYLTALRNLFRPILCSELERKLSDSATDQPALYENLAVYLMMKGQHKIDKKFILEVLTAEYEKQYPGSDFSESRLSFSHHLVNLLGQDFDEIAYRKDLVDSTRQKLSSYSPAIRAFSLLIRDPQITKLDPWRINEALGPLGPIAIERRSGASLYETIPGVYMAENFKRFVVPAVQKVSRQVIDEDWVIFPKSAREKKNFTVEQLSGEVLRLFSSKYIDVWDNLINDIAISKFTDFKKEMVILQAISGPASPLESILKNISHETTLSDDSTQSEEKEKPEVDQKKDDLPNFISNEKTIGKIITLHFSKLHDFLKGSPSLLGETLRMTNQLRSLIAPIAASSSLGSGENNKISLNNPISDNLQSLQRIAHSAPSSVGDTIDYLVRQTTLLLESTNKIDVESAWKSEIYGFCKNAINDRYPFASSNDEVTLADFIHMFSPDGIMDRFFKRNIEAFVDTSSPSGWKNISNAEIKFPISQDAVNMFQRANIIKRVFFPGDVKEPRLSFTVELTDLDIKAKGFFFELGGQSISYQYGMQQAVPMVWPMGNNAVTVKFTNVKYGEPTSFSLEGPWALFRLLQKQQFSRQSPTEFILNIDFSGRYSTLLFTASTIINPFQKNIMQGFRCLPSLVRN